MVLAMGGTSDQACSRLRYYALTNDGVNSTGNDGGTVSRRLPRVLDLLTTQQDIQRSMITQGSWRKSK